MRRFPTPIFLLLLLSVSISVAGQETGPATGTISTAEILEKSLIATGGIEAHQRLQSLSARGDFGFANYISSHPLGDYSFAFKAPSSDMLEIKLISHGTCWTGRREEHSFTRCAVEGPGMINGVGIGIVEEDWRSLLEWDFSRRYAKVELIGRAQVEGKWAFAVRFTPRTGDPVVRFYDQTTFLLLRMDQVQRFRWNKSQPEQAYGVTTFFRNYKDRAGLKLPAVIAVKRAEGDLEFTVGKIQPNAKINDSVFQ